MSMTVVLLVTPLEPIDPERYVGRIPADIAAALEAMRQPVRAGLGRMGSGPYRLHFHLSGPDRVEAGQRLESQLRHLGYDADVSFSA